jgi:hypothetical protein
MSPEQVAGDLGRLGPATDVYSLGATLYSVLTGRAPFTDRDPRIVLQKVPRGEFPAPRTVEPSVPPALEAVCLKAMAREAKYRYSSPLDLAADIENWLADQPVGAYSEGPWGRLMRQLRQHPVLGWWIFIIICFDVVYFMREFAAPYLDQGPDYFLIQRDVVFYPISYSVALSQAFGVVGAIFGHFLAKERRDTRRFMDRRFMDRIATRGVTLGAILGAVVGFITAIRAFSR